MKVGGKLLLILVVVAAVPLVVSAVTSLSTYERELAHQLHVLHDRSAQYGARIASGTLDSAQRTLRGLARTIPWVELSAEERHGALLLMFEQLEDIAIVALLDSEGKPVSASVHGSPSAAGSHPAMPLDMLAMFDRSIPASSPGHGWVTGDPVTTAGVRDPIVPISLAIDGAGGSTWTLAVGISLRGVCDELVATAPSGVTVRLFDARGGVLCGSASSIGDTLTATAAATNGWRVVADQRREVAFASIRRIRIQSLFWIVVGVIAAIAAGLVLTQAIRRPLRRLTAGAEALAGGSLDHRVDLSGNDEFAALARTFNRMGSEIEQWSSELNRRVDERTAELKAAQDQLLQSRKLGAISALGAGIAHEINNPLTGVLGMTQVLLARKDQLDARVVRNLSTIEREAQRIRDIVERVSTLAQETVHDATRLDLSAVVDAVALASASKLAAAHVELKRTFAANVPRVLGNARQLEQAIDQLVDNSIKAMPAGGSLMLRIRSIEDELVALDVVDTGRGIPAELLDRIFEPFFTTKDDWRGVGLGLTLAHRIVEVHQGRIRASSLVGSGTTMTVTLPAARHGAHLH